MWERSNNESRKKKKLAARKKMLKKSRPMGFNRTVSLCVTKSFTTTRQNRKKKQRGREGKEREEGVGGVLKLEGGGKEKKAGERCRLPVAK